MQSGFDANGPARKPRPPGGRVLPELTSEPQVVEDPAAEADAPSVAAADPDETVAPPTAHLIRSAPPSAAMANASERSQLAASHDRIVALRERLAAAARPAAVAREPRRTAAGVREAIDQLRARADAAVKERNQIAAALDEARAQLARTATELERERKGRAATEALAAERQKIA